MLDKHARHLSFNSLNFDKTAGSDILITYMYLNSAGYDFNADNSKANPDSIS